MKTFAESEHDKAAQLLQDMLVYLNEHPERHTLFMDRWFRLCVLHNTCVYPAKPEGAAAGRRLLYGKPARVVEVIESAMPVGQPGVWFVKVVDERRIVEAKK